MLFLPSKLSPPPPPPPPLPPPLPEPAPKPDPTPAASKFVQKEKIFVRNLPLWIRKNEIAELFRHFSPLKNVILVKGHNDSERKVGYCFMIFGGPTAEEAAAKAVEADGVEFQGRVLTIRLDDGERLRARQEERERWARGEGSGRQCIGAGGMRRGMGPRKSSARWRRASRRIGRRWYRRLRGYLSLLEESLAWGLTIMQGGDKHHARATFENMRARGEELSSYVFTNLVHAYAVARDMQGALSCIDEMETEGIELTVICR